MKKVKTRIIVRKGNENIALKVEDIILFYRDNTVIMAVDKDEKEYLCDANLTMLENELDDNSFFRANRKYLINIQYVKGFKSFEKVKLEIYLHLSALKHQIIISQETAPKFKKWLSEI